MEEKGPRKGAEAVKISVESNIGERQKIAPDGRYIPSSKGFHKNSDIDNEVNEQIKSGVIYQLGRGFTDIPSDRWSDFEQLIKYLLDNGVEVHFYLPAWHPEVYEYFVTHENYSGVSKIENEVRSLGAKYNIPVHGSYNPRLNSFTTDDFMDWLHLQPNKMYIDYQSIH